MSDSLQVDMASLSGISMRSFDFLDSSFFKIHGPSRSLPTPAQVRASSDPAAHRSKPPPVKFEELGLLVKFGPHVYVNEAQCLQMIKKTFGNRIPVPEVYGWRIDEQEVFIYMQLIRGHTLLDRWNHLSHSERAAICSDLRDMLTVLRSAKPPLPGPYIGSVLRGPLTDYVFEEMPGRGPFPNVEAFHDWLSSLLWRGLPHGQRGTDPWRPFLPDEEPISLTHADLHRANIMISGTSPPHIMAIIDWGQSGWYPAYWEWCKACYTAPYDGEWRIEWIPKFLDSREDEFAVISEYTRALGSV